MPEGAGRSVETPAAGRAEVYATGAPAAGEFHCGGCGYGVIVDRELPRCPMCGGTRWRHAVRGHLGRPAPEQLH